MVRMDGAFQLTVRLGAQHGYNPSGTLQIGRRRPQLPEALVRVIGGIAVRLLATGMLPDGSKLPTAGPAAGAGAIE